MGIVGRLDQYASMLAGEFDDYSMSENLLTYSGIPSANWNANLSATLTNNSSTSPDGSTNATQIAASATAGSGVFRTFSLTSATVYTYSVFVKAVSGSNTIYFGTDIGTDTRITVNTSTGVASLNFGSPTNITSTSYPNGWYRVSFTFTASATTTHSFIIYNLTASANTWLAWGAQIETGTLTDYTPTTTTAITRVLPSTTNTNITGLGTYYSSGFDENVGFTTFLSANVFAPYDPVYDEFGGTSFGAGQGRYMRQYTDKSVIVYNEIDEVSDFRDIVRTGLILDLDAAQPLSYKGTGTAWNDLSDSANNGTLVNTPTYSNSNGGYFDFDYTQSENVTFSNTSSLQFLNRLPYTLEAWVYPTRNPGASNWTGIFDRESVFGAGRDGYNINFLGSAGTQTTFATERFIAGTNNFVFVNIDSSLSVNAWQHIVATYDGTTLSLYRNASSVGTPVTSTGNISNTSKSLTIGVRGGQYFGGRIANAKIYNRALTATEVLQNYNALKHRFGL